MMDDLNKDDSEEKYDIARLKQQGDKAGELHPAVHDTLRSWYDKKGGAKGLLTPEQYEKFKGIKNAKEKQKSIKIVKDE